MRPGLALAGAGWDAPLRELGRNVASPVQHAQYLNMLLAALDDEITAHIPEADRKPSQIAAAVTEPWVIGQPIESFDQRIHQPIRGVRVSLGDVVEDEGEIVLGRRRDL